MSKSFLKIGLGLLTVAGLLYPAAAAPSGTRKLSGHVPAIISRLTAIGAEPPTNQLHLAIGLPLRNQAALADLLRQINDPASPNYHHYLTPAEFTAQFGPTEQDYQAVLNFAKTNGLTVEKIQGNRMVVQLTGKVSAAEKMFNVTLHKYRHPTENRDFFAPDTEPSVPADLSVLDVSGLSSYNRPHSFMKFQPLASMPASATPLAGSGPGGYYMGNDFHKAYVPGTTLTGAGQKVALVQFDGYFSSDIAAYAQLAGLPALSITNILLDGFNGSPTLTGGEGEVTLDIELVNAMAPGLSQLLVYEENPNIFNPVVVLNQIAMDNAAKQVSCSWSLGVAPSGSGTINQILQQMALQGQSFFQASGDSDALLPGEADAQNGFFGICCNPYVTSVGGTKLFTDAGGNYTSESVWNDRVPNGGQGGYEGGGGGVSDFYTTPSWQQGFGTAANHGSATGRNFPDVAFTATDVFVILYGQGNVFGGTSCAAPLWGAFASLINQQAALNGKSPVGFLNPTLYALAKTTAYTNYFRDTTVGDNTWPGSPTNFFAVPGYDLATGLGTPNGTNLINALTGATISTGPIISAPPGPWGTNLAALNGSNPNGLWFLFVQDDKPVDSGVISNGWFITLTTANPVGFAADNELITTPASQSVIAGSHWSVTLTVTNYGPSVSSNVVVSDVLPAGLSLVSSNVSAGVLTSSDPTRLAWSLGTLPVNAGGVLTLDFIAATAGIYTNAATVTSTTVDPNSDDDAANAILMANAIESPVLSAASVTGNGGFQFAISGNPGASTLIQASTNLVNWLNLYTNVSPFIYTNLDATNFPQRFYRAVVATP